MHILTDAGADLTSEQTAGLTIHSVPLTFTLDGTTYRSGIDIEPAAFYELLAGTKSFPTTSQPAPGDFAAAYQELTAGGDRDILSIHISSGLSGTLNAAQLGAGQVPEAHVTFVDTLTLSAAQGWEVEVAGRMSQAGWALERILATLDRIRAVHRINLHARNAEILGTRRPHQPYPGASGANSGSETHYRRGEGTWDVCRACA